MSFDREAFIDGYVECALWADCMPADVCQFCDEPVAYAENGLWVHVATRAHRCDPADPFRVATRDDTLESGGGQGLTLRDGARERMAVDCLTFIEANASDLLAACDELGDWHGSDTVRGADARYNGAERAGHDFWFTRNGHGTGFWDRDLGELGDRLSDAASAYGEADDHCPFDCGDGTADV